MHGVEVFIPEKSLLKNSHWDESDKIWKWSYDSSDNMLSYFYNNKDEVLFKTSETNFSKKDLVRSSLSESESKSILVIGSMLQDGLGPVSWWS